MRPVERTKAKPLVVAGENTILTIHDTRHEVALAVGTSHALLVDNGLRLEEISTLPTCIMGGMLLFIVYQLMGVSPREER